MNSFLSLQGIDSAAVTAAISATEKRDLLLEMAKPIVLINSPETADKAVSVLREMVSFTKQIEASRKDVKQPIVDLGRKIDALADKLTSDVLSRAAVIDRLVGTYRMEQKRREEDLRRKAWEDEQRIIREAEAKKMEAVARSRTNATAQKKLDKIDDQTEQAIFETRVAALTAAGPKLEGVAAREDVVFEITDIYALYESHAAFVTLSPNNAAIKAALKANRNLSLPGVKHHWEARSSIR